MLIYTIIAVVLCSTICLAQGETDIDDDCLRIRKYITIEQEGCEPTRTKVPTCEGTCRSFDVVIPRAPFFEKQCNCCKSVSHTVRRRSLQFDCNGRMEQHNVFIPIIDECACTRCEVF